MFTSHLGKYLHFYSEKKPALFLKGEIIIFKEHPMLMYNIVLDVQKIVLMFYALLSVLLVIPVRLVQNY
jgi:hypothetical protein